MMEPSQALLFRRFLVVWLGQLVSLIGSGMTVFALGVSVFLATHSATRFALIAFFGSVPGVAALPFAGVLVDRWGGRRAMITADAGEALCTSVLALLLWTGTGGIVAIYAFAMVSALFSALRWPAYSSLTPRLAGPVQLSRANGLVQLAEAVAPVVAPFLAGLMVVKLSIASVLAIDVCTYLFGIATVALVPRDAVRRAESGEAGGGSAAELWYGWRYIRARPGLFALLLFFAATNFTVLGVPRTLCTPLILGFTDARVLGTVLSIGGAGLFLGALSMSIWSGPRRRVDGVLAFTFVQGLFVAVSGLRPSVLLVSVSLFVVSFCFPFVAGCSQTLWQRKVPLHVQGRVFAVRRMVGWSTFPLAYLAAGPAADLWFEPLLRKGGALSGSVGRLIGVGPGRGIALLFVALGVLTMVTVVASLRIERLRLVEDEVPDADPEDADQVAIAKMTA